MLAQYFAQAEQCDDAAHGHCAARLSLKEERRPFDGSALDSSAAVTKQLRRRRRRKEGRNEWIRETEAAKANRGVATLAEPMWPAGIPRRPIRFKHAQLLGLDRAAIRSPR